jgi:alkylhydroperoxidase/carboxymuconolactone decarboxylase family protein YurZ
MRTSERHDRLRSEFQEMRGYWSPFWDDLLELDPDFFETFVRFSAVPWQSGPLEPKVKELIYIAIDAATTHLFKPGLRIHLRQALRQGATRDEILEVFELVSVVGMHSCTVGVPLLVQALEELGHQDALSDRTLSARQHALRQRFEEQRGYWSTFWEDLLLLDTNFFEAYLAFSTMPWQTGPLEPKIKELIYIAVDGATTHLFTPGLRLHIRQALKHGATPQEILEVLELVSIMGIHTCVVAAPLLREAVQELEGLSEVPPKTRPTGRDQATAQ